MKSIVTNYPLIHLDLFSGIGGFTLAAQWTGKINTIAFCEINGYCDIHALYRNWPHIPNLVDVRRLCLAPFPGTNNSHAISTESFTNEYGYPDIITAGVPCQPASIIGKRKGAKDSRWLWPDTMRIVTELCPTWFIGENPPGLLTIDKGDRFYEIIEGFQQAGYGVWWETVPATAVGGGHRRERTWIIAYSSSARLERYTRNGNPHDQSRWLSSNTLGSVTPKSDLPFRYSPMWWKNQSPVQIVVDGVSNPASWKQAVIATGNAIVPQVAYEILQSIITVEAKQLL